MMNLKKITALLLCCATLFSCMIFSAGAASADDFIDVDPYADYYEAVNWAIEKGYMKGTGGNKFSPEKTLTRAQFATLMASFSGDDLAPYAGKNTFKDVKAKDWYAATSVWAAEKGIMSGTGGGNFSPNTVITRQQIAVMMKNYASVNGMLLEFTHEKVRTMDRGNAKAAAWAQDACDYAYKVGFIPLDENNRQYPTQLVTRADAAMFLYNFSGAIDRITTPNEKKVVAYCNAAGTINIDDLAKVDIINFQPAHADGVKKTINENYMTRVNVIRRESKYVNPDLKYVLTIATNGGEDIEKWMYPYSNCDTFVNATVALVEKYDFDGVDFDYEFPTGNIPQANLEYYLTSLRAKLDKLAEKTGKDYLITMALPGSTWVFSLYSNLEELQHYVDYFNLMNYDMHSERDMTYNQCALYSNPNLPPVYTGGSTDAQIQECLRRGLQRSKLLVGAGVYSQQWSDVQGNGTVGMYCPGRANSDQPKTLNELYHLINYNDPTASMDGFYTYWDDVVKAVSLYNPSTGYLYSFDDMRSTEEKCKYINRFNLGGLMVFDYTNVAGGAFDYFGNVNNWLGK